MGSSGRPPPPDIVPAPALSLSLSLEGLFGRNEEPALACVNEVQDGDDANKSRKSCHKDDVEQIRAFRASPHPDETQRQQLSEQLGLSASHQTSQERQENSLLKPELENLREQNRVMRELIKKLESSRCPTCSVAAATNTEDQMPCLENARLEAEVETLRRVTLPSCPTGAGQIRNRNSLYDYFDVGHDDKTKFLELARRALDEMTTMCSYGEPLWARSVETGRDVLNYDEYARLFRRGEDDSGDRRAAWSVEASRETAVVYRSATQLVGAFVDVNQWKEMFPSMITKASTLEVIHAGQNDNRDGIVQLMFAEVQRLTPLVPTRELYFLRHCKKLGTHKWAIVDVSLDDFEPGAQTLCTLTPCMCLKKPSGCIVEEQSSGCRCKVTWVEHAECRDEAAVPSSGVAFGARRWVAALRLQCERMAFFSVATNIPTGISSVGRQSVLKLAQRMTSSLYRVIGASRDRAWIKAPNNDGARDIRRTSRKSTGEHGEPQGLIARVVLSVWLPVNPAALFGFLLDESRRHEWDLLLPGHVQRYVSLRMGNDRGNCVTAYGAKSSAEEATNKVMIIQDSSTSPCGCESTIAYAPIDAAVLRSVIFDGRDSSAVAVLPFGFAVTPAVFTSSRTAVQSIGSLFTMAFQALATSSATDAAALPTDDVARLAFCTLGKIKKALGCGVGMSRSAAG